MTVGSRKANQSPYAASPKPIASNSQGRIRQAHRNQQPLMREPTNEQNLGATFPPPRNKGNSTSSHKTESSHDGHVDLFSASLGATSFTDRRRVGEPASTPPLAVGSNGGGARRTPRQRVSKPANHTAEPTHATESHTVARGTGRYGASIESMTGEESGGNNHHTDPTFRQQQSNNHCELRQQHQPQQSRRHSGIVAAAAGSARGAVAALHAARGVDKDSSQLFRGGGSSGFPPGSTPDCDEFAARPSAAPPSSASPPCFPASGTRTFSPDLNEENNTLMPACNATDSGGSQQQQTSIRGQLSSRAGSSGVGDNGGGGNDGRSSSAVAGTRPKELTKGRSSFPELNSKPPPVSSLPPSPLLGGSRRGGQKKGDPPPHPNQGAAVVVAATNTDISDSAGSRTKNKSSGVLQRPSRLVVTSSASSLPAEKVVLNLPISPLVSSPPKDREFPADASTGIVDSAMDPSVEHGEEAGGTTVSSLSPRKSASAASAGGTPGGMERILELRRRRKLNQQDQQQRQQEDRGGGGGGEEQGQGDKHANRDTSSATNAAEGRTPQAGQEAAATVAGCQAGNGRGSASSSSSSLRLNSPQRASQQQQQQQQPAVVVVSPPPQTRPQTPRATPPPLVGLSNLGNTCFMNATLQCLLSTHALTDHFAITNDGGGGGGSGGGGGGGRGEGGEVEAEGVNSRGRRRRDRSSGPVVGSSSGGGSGGGGGGGSTREGHGEVAAAFTRLVREMRCSKPHSSVAPRELKSVVSRLAPWLAGYQQQDCQEFMRFLLDGLSEDLNRAPPRTSGSSPQTPEPPLGTSRAPPAAAANPRQPPPTNGDCEGAASPSPLSEGESLAEREESEKMWQACKNRNSSIVEDIFQGQLRSRVECQACRHVSFCFDPFLDISVPIPDPDKALVGGGAGGSSGGVDRHTSRRMSSASGAKSSAQSCTLEECLSAFTETEVLDHENRYTCDRCKTPQRCHKRLTVHRLPQVLVLHIKRFQFSAYSREKLSTGVTFPLKSLNLAPFLSYPSQVAAATPAALTSRQEEQEEEVADDDEGNHRVRPSGQERQQGGAMYDLYGVSNHMGGLGGGHYTASCLPPGSEKWYYFNDSNVTPIADERDLQSPVAYVLFYRRRKQP